MTKYPENFDYASDPHTEKYAAGTTDMYVVNQSAMFEKLFDQQRLLQVDHSEYRDSIVTESSLTFIVSGDSDDDRRLLQTSSVRYDGAMQFDDKDYFDALGKLLPDQFALESNDFFHNHRFLTSYADGLDLSVSRHADSRAIIMSNSNYAQHQAYPGRFMKLEAPLLSDSTVETASEQVIAMMQLHVFSIEALTRMMRQRKASSVFVFAPEGRIYPENDFAKAVEMPPEHHAETAVTRTTEMPEKPKGVMFNDIAGLEPLKEKLRNVAESFRDSEIMQAYGVERPQGVLLYGPPGTGKTTLARALANEIGGTLVSIDANDIYDKWLGNSERNISEIFEEAKEYTTPTVLLFDEFDALFDSSDRATASTNNVAGIFKKQAQALREINPNVILFATTNHKDRIDASLVRSGRFDIKEYVDAPTEKELLALYELILFGAKDEAEAAGIDLFDEEEIDIYALAQASEGLTGADVTEIVRRTKFAVASKRARDIRDELLVDDPSIYRITQQQLLNEIKAMKSN